MSIYEQLGKDVGIRTAVDDFYRRVLADPALSAYFDGVDMTRLRGHQKKLLVQVTGGPVEYDGREPPRRTAAWRSPGRTSTAWWPTSRRRWPTSGSTTRPSARSAVPSAATATTSSPARRPPADRQPTGTEAPMNIPAMRACFAKAAAAGDEAPLYFYAHLFLSHPETRRMFPVSMATQRDRLFAALGEVVSKVDDLDALVPILQQLGRDHRKFGTAAEHYPAVGASLLATLQHFDDDWNVELAQDWTAAYQLVAQVMIDAAQEAADEPAWWEAEVAPRAPHLDIAVLRLQPEAPLEYLPGQSISLESDLRPRLWRYYSSPTRRARTGSWRSTSRRATAGR